MKIEKFHSKGLSYKCHKPVSELTKQEAGLHCITCSKNIIDFRNKSKKEYEKIVAENKSGCGVFYDYQINDEYTLAVDLKKPIFIFSFLSSLFFSREAFSQDTLSSKTEFVQLDSQSETEEVKNKKEVRQAKRLNKKFERGRNRVIRGRRRFFVSRRFPFIHYKRSRVCQVAGKFW